MNFKIKKTALLSLALVALLAGCGREARAVDASLEAEVSIREAVIEADPEQAVREVYASLPDARIQALNTGLFRELFSDLQGKIQSYYGNISDPTGGLADMILIQPAEGADDTGKSNRDAVRDALRRYQEKRIQEFENYDILDSFTISNDAEVFDQGEFVILLMLPDNEEARGIVDLYIPL